ncbi:uncharacterized protein LOC119327657 [Triticum dicoccoides]|uniref:uncharacterized protein LOC119327657 n=1 Tax=Triticum dicoccoides TaxID=85692 RepID=UPI0018912C00|nr:uncharacterized protein LOC119327657 [Triticum dicoccoides]
MVATIRCLPGRVCLAEVPFKLLFVLSLAVWLPKRTSPCPKRTRTGWYSAPATRGRPRPILFSTPSRHSPHVATHPTEAGEENSNLKEVYAWLCKLSHPLDLEPMFIFSQGGLSR